MKNKYIYEVCVDDFISTEKACFHNAKRVEICHEMDKGGFLPNLEYVKILKRRQINPVVMLRNNDGFEVGSTEKLNEILKMIKVYRKAGVKEFIFGFIKDKDIDIETCKIIIASLKKGEKYIFHRAIDTLGNYDKNIPILINLGFSRVLTSGGISGLAAENTDNLKYLVEQYNLKIKIIVAGKVTKENLEEILNKTNATEFHGSRILW